MVTATPLPPTPLALSAMTSQPARKVPTKLIFQAARLAHEQYIGPITPGYACRGIELYFEDEWLWLL